MKRVSLLLIPVVVVFLLSPLVVYGQTPSVPNELLKSDALTNEATETSEATVSATTEPSPAPTPRPDITQTTEETIEPLAALLNSQQLGAPLPFNFFKYAIRYAVNEGIPANTIVLLLLLPAIATFIAAARHIIGLRGFGIFLPAALSVVFLAIGPVVGLILFLVIVMASLLTRMVLRRLKVKLQYLPRMALILWFVVIGVLVLLFMAPVVNLPDFSNISIFPVLILVLLAEDFSKVQLGKSARTAVSLASETIILALLSYIILVTQPLREYALLHPEALLTLVLIIDVLLGKYIGLRFIEYWKYRKLIAS